MKKINGLKLHIKSWSRCIVRGITMKKLLNHIKRWWSWRKYNTNAWWYKFLVLLGICHSPSFMNWWSINKGYLGFLKRHWPADFKFSCKDGPVDDDNPSIEITIEEVKNDTSATV